MNFDIRNLCISFVVAFVGGCASELPQDDFKRASAAAGIDDPPALAFESLPTDVGGQDVEVLELTEAVRCALETDPEVQAALARLEIAAADARQARLLPNPVMSVVARFPEAGGSAVIEAGLSADLLSLLFRPRRTSAADNRLRAASSEALIAVLDTIARAQETYVTVQALDAQTQVLTERRSLISRLIELSKARVRAGEAGQLDVLTLDSERVSLDVDMVELTSDRRQRRLAFAPLGRPSGRTDWKLEAWSPPDRVTLNESDWIEAALQHRPEIQSHRWELVALGDDLAAARFGVFEGSEVGLETEREDTWSLGPSISSPIPLFDWGKARRQKAKAQQVEARHLLTQSRREVVEDVRRAIEAFEASQVALDKVRSELMPLEEQRRLQAETAYKSGFADVTAVLLAEKDQAAARAKLIELQQKVSAAHFRLQRSIGGAGVQPGASSTQPTSRNHHSTEQP